MPGEKRTDVKFLGELQSLDSAIQRLEKERSTVPGRVAEMRDSVERLNKDIAELEAELEELRKERRKKERELDEKVEVLKRLRSQKSQVKTNQAYSALIKEIEEIEKEKSALEEDVLIFLETNEKKSQLLDEKKNYVQESKAELAELEEENRRRVDRINQELSGFLEKRKNASTNVAEGLLRNYEKVRKVKGGLGFVPVRSNTCQGCFMELPPQVVNELMDGRILTCENCQRLLYLEGE